MMVLPDWSLRAVKGLAGLLWAGGLMLMGLWLWEHFGDRSMEGRLLSLSALAGGLFVFMWMVADDVFPASNEVVTGFLKALVGVIFWASIGLVVIVMGVGALG
ncbi:hypothetical protein [Mucisphaera sp.]|uniref:hypothetical protein n=1 Tax=Mucisphaera sp. TaxID=2913024 RepID=UPI003D0A0F1A